MRSKKITSILLSSLLSISIACTPFTSLNAMAAEEITGVDNVITETEDQLEESSDSDNKETLLTEQSDEDNKTDEAQTGKTQFEEDISAEESTNEQSTVDEELSQNEVDADNSNTTNNEDASFSNTNEVSEESGIGDSAKNENAEDVDPDISSDINISGNCGDSITWVLSGTENSLVLTISGSGPMNNYTIDDIPWSVYSTSITSVILEGEITSLGSYAFYSLSSISKVSLPDTIEAINEYCFANCSSLNTINIPNSVSVIGDNAFSGCGLTEITYEGNEEEWNSIDIGQGNEVLSLVNFHTIKEVTPVIELSSTSFTYNGEVQKPELVVKVEETVISDENYDVEFSGECIDVGTYKATITLKGDYTGTSTVSFKIIAKKATPTVSLAKSVYAYTGSNIKPAATVKVGKTVLKKNQDYTITYPKTCKYVGAYKVTVKLKGNYSGTKAVTYKINPKATRLNSVVGSNDRFTVKWAKQTAQVTGYQIQYSLKSNFSSGNKSVTINKNSINSKTIKKPSAGKTYYVRVRTYKKSGKKTYYSSWSNSTSTAVKKSFGKKTSYILGPGQTKTFAITLDNRMMVAMAFNFETLEYISYGGIKIVAKDSKGTIIQRDYYSFEDCEEDQSWENWCWTGISGKDNNGRFLPPGDYKYTVKNTSDGEIQVTYSLTGFVKFADTASIYKNKTVVIGNWVKIGKIGEGVPYTDISLGSKKIITNLYIDANKNIWVFASKLGTDNVTVKLKNGKKYTTKVKVKGSNPNFYAYLSEYNTRDNYFTVVVKNLRGSDLIIIKNGSKVEDVDYKAYDRWMKNGNNVVVKHGQTKYIRFYVNGSITWPDYEDYTLFAKIKFEGETYNWHVWYCDSAYQESGKWYNTYWNDEAYQNWLY